MKKQKMRVLLVEDDEDDYILVRDLLAEIAHADYEVHWVWDSGQALGAIDSPHLDICLLDYRLGELDGIDLLSEAAAKACRLPIILLTAHGDSEVDARALSAGAVDFLNKEELSGPLLDRAIRYSVRQSKILQDLRISEGKIRRLSRDLLVSQETERNRIAGELHDSVGQALAAMKFTVESGLGQISQGNTAEGQATFQRVVSMIRSVIEEIHRIQNDLQPAMLGDLGIAATLDWFCREHRKTYEGIGIEKRITLTQEEVPPALQVTLFRLVQEAFNNIARHSKADQVFLNLEDDSEGLTLTIRDNGQGFDPEEQRQHPKGKGLGGMKGRAELSGGTFVLQTAPGEGTTLSFKWPFPAKGA